ncbi:MAG TPA: tRNA uridine-5-carboxymethylaminomethyl(34) synthesis GTPase MnmE [Burkholderiaceae bacterium]|nr:tRNA uridine-5-carboxymethylaminomethyl(34) synthesis GTPase MnmE [Burkholderiaceae bacterium]HQR77334.1 tRNA uridine-5-carboxymethylaminomethyl(34) synthesis GTPase MnmE [Burkholderiaceae bacterium]
MNSDPDPIVAIATAPGRGGIGIVRVSGSNIAPVIEAVLGPAQRTLEPRHAKHCTFLGSRGEPLDDGIALYFPAPNSYTGEHVLELQGHGGPVVLRMLVARCLEAGRSIALRVAEPGEFTRRAYLNDRLDLAQAEAVADLIDASTEAAARSAARSLTGEFSRTIQALTAQLTDLRALVEATLDFPEEEIDFLEKADATGRLQQVRAALDEVLLRAQQGAVLRDGLHVVLVGAPNVGKSSLLNALAGEDVAIVTAVPGTTRDRIAQPIQIGGLPLDIIDTAGVRETADEVESIGIARTLSEVERADVVVHLVDAAHPSADADVLAQVSARARRGVPLLTVVNKIDLTGDAPRVEGDTIFLSARDGQGVELLREQLYRLAGWDRSTGGENVYLARERHLQALAQSRAHLEVAAMHAARRDAVLDLFAEELRLAQSQLASITGEFSADDLLGVIFSRFCIGK